MAKQNQLLKQKLLMCYKGKDVITGELKNCNVIEKDIRQKNNGECFCELIHLIEPRFDMSNHNHLRRGMATNKVAESSVVIEVVT